MACHGSSRCCRRRCGTSAQEDGKDTTEHENVTDADDVEPTKGEAFSGRSTRSAAPRSARRLAREIFSRLPPRRGSLPSCVAKVVRGLVCGLLGSRCPRWALSLRFFSSFRTFFFFFFFFVVLLLFVSVVEVWCGWWCLGSSSSSFFFLARDGYVFSSRGVPVLRIIVAAVFRVNEDGTKFLIFDITK